MCLSLSACEWHSNREFRFIITHINFVYSWMKRIITSKALKWKQTKITSWMHWVECQQEITHKLVCMRTVCITWKSWPKLRNEFIWWPIIADPSRCARNEASPIKHEYVYGITPERAFPATIETNADSGIRLLRKLISQNEGEQNADGSIVPPRNEFIVFLF